MPRFARNDKRVSKDEQLQGVELVARGGPIREANQERGATRAKRGQESACADSQSINHRHADFQSGVVRLLGIYFNE